VGQPKTKNARLFYRVAQQRFVDAQILQRAGRTTGAIYLAGYGVECILKALVLNSTPETKQLEMISSFRGRTGHDFGWLRNEYVNRTGLSIPGSISRLLMRVNSWAVDLRYQPGNLKNAEVDLFVNAANEVIRWADGRL
jgi:hypothetical protein